MAPIQIDGSFGEGGGQILRSSLALAMVTGKPVSIEKIRAGRKKPGLMRQHLTAVRAASQICNAKIAGDAIGSAALTFEPGSVVAGDYHFAVGTAGSVTLVLQTVLLPLLLADRPSRLTLEGGTHNPHAPPFDFLVAAYLPFINRMGPRVTATLERPGFHPAGGGRMTVEIQPAGPLTPFELLERGPLRGRRAQATIAHLPRHVAERELNVVREWLRWEERDLEIREERQSLGPGNVITSELKYENVTEVFTGFGDVGRPAEAVAGQAVEECRRYWKATAPAGPHLTDQLLLPLALAGGGAFRSTGLTPHALTHIDVIGKFLDVRIATKRCPDGVALVRVG